MAVTDDRDTVLRAEAEKCHEAEEALLGAAMLSADALEVAATEVESDDFRSEHHRHIHEALLRLWESGTQRADPVLVADELNAKGQLELVGGTVTLTGMQAVCPTTANAAAYARIVVDFATKRRLWRAGNEIAQMATTGDPAVELLEIAKHVMSTVDIPIRRMARSQTVEEFLDREDKFNWLIDGLIERRDRAIITGGEGGGKSVLLRQIAVMSAAGLHPFSFRPIPPVRVLLVDVENSPAQVRRSLEPMIQHVRAHVPTWNPENLTIETPGPLDLAGRHDSRWLIERVAVNRPDMLITGPIYKLHNEDPNEELPARRVIRTFDLIRTKYDVSVILEAHTAKGSAGAVRSLNPYGASIWMRWPEFGYGLRPDKEAGTVDGHAALVNFASWRPPRDQREWPTVLAGDGAAFWPWRDASHHPVQEAGW